MEGEDQPPPPPPTIYVCPKALTVFKRVNDTNQGKMYPFVLKDLKGVVLHKKETWLRWAHDHTDGKHCKLKNRFIGIKHVY